MVGLDSCICHPSHMGGAALIYKAAGGTHGCRAANRLFLMR